jgi:hypothetical protein
MASLCISPVHAGIMLFSKANSSFILLRLRLSIRLWAVFLAILRPAALVALGCFFLDSPLAEALPAPAPDSEPGAEFLALAAAALPPALAVSLVEVELPPDSWPRGFIWIIFLERVGGGGRANVVPLASLFVAADERLRDLTVSAACMG